MATTLSPMPRKSKEPTKVIRIRADLVDMIDIITAHTHVSVGDLLDPVLRPFVEKKHREAVGQLKAQVFGDKKRPPRADADD